MDASPLLSLRLPPSNKTLQMQSAESEESDFESEQENQAPDNRKSTRKLSESRRAAHLESEKKRRLHINQGFEDLRELVPRCHEMDSKAEILRKSAEYIRELKGLDREARAAETMSVTSEEETLAKSLTLLRSRSKSAN